MMTESVRPLMLLCAAIPVLFAGCETPRQYALTPDLFSLELPGYLDRVSDLHSRASIQFENARREVYVIALHSKRGQEDGPRNLAQFLDQEAAAYEENLISRTFTESKLDPTAQFPLLQREAEGKLRRNNYEVWQLFSATETGENYVFIASWTLQENRERYEADLRAIARSLRAPPDPAAIEALQRAAE